MLRPTHHDNEYDCEIHKLRRTFVWKSNLPILTSVFILGTAVAHPTYCSAHPAVIDYNISKVQTSQHLSLTPNPGTLIPLEDDFSPITHLQMASHKKFWFDEMQKKSELEHKTKEI